MAPEPRHDAARWRWSTWAATPEDDTHGRFLQALRAAAPEVPLLLLADSAAFDRRFAATPARGAERRAGLAAAGRRPRRGLGWRRRWTSPDLAAAEAAFEAALSR